MEENEEIDYDHNFPCHAGLGAFDDDTAMEEREAEAAENEPILGGHCAVRGKIVRVKRRG